jgi:transposase-like protein
VKSPLLCPRCGSTRSWSLTSGRRRCARCRFDWRPGRWPLRLTAAEWRAILRWFVRDVSSAAIAQETGLERKRVLRALTVIRRAIARDAAPEGHSAGPRAAGRDAPVIGLSVTRGRASAVVLKESDAQPLRRAVREHRSSRVDAPEGFPYSAIVYRGRFYRLARASAGGGAPSRFGELEAFWGYLQRHLGARGGIRRERLGLYLAEYAWRYNRRRFPAARRVQELADLVSAGTARWRERDFAVRR